MGEERRGTKRGLDEEVGLSQSSETPTEICENRMRDALVGYTHMLLGEATREEFVVMHRDALEALKEIEQQHGIPACIEACRAKGGLLPKESLVKDMLRLYCEDPDPPLEAASRYVLFPIKYLDIWNFYKKAEASFWRVEEINLAGDRAGWKALSKDEQYFLRHVLGFFAASDGIVGENLVERFAREVAVPEVRAFYGFQLAVENIHSEMYSLLIDTFIDDPKQKMEVLRATETMPCVEKKARWALKWIDSPTRTFAERLVAFAAVEGIFFSGSFCAIFWLKSQGKMTEGLGTSNEFIARDEGLHRDFACLLYAHLKKKPPMSTVQAIVREAVEVEVDFTTDSLPVGLLGMNSALMQQYIEFVADHLLESLGVPVLYRVTNPFAFMDNISLQGKTNFFEKTVADYQLNSMQRQLSEGAFTGHSRGYSF
eukprot:Sspe_Gene.94359::Locus_66754_Transcript_1_1_Confidence_1.000_Length_2104::g.94359::m.94359/K10808/RRM2; ribonucleoside-diphosphate reductase subunit M2